MIILNQVYLARAQEKSSIISDAIIAEETRTLSFSVDSQYTHLLHQEGGECFVMGLIPLAMQTGQDIVYHGPLSERFLHGVNEYLIPAMAAARSGFRKVSVSSDRFSARETSGDGIGAVFSNHPSFENILSENEKEGIYPVTHICAIQEAHGTAAKAMAQKYGTEYVFVNQNLASLYPELSHDTQTFLNLAGALSLRRGLQIMFCCSENGLTEKAPVNKEHKNMDLVLCSFAATDTSRVYLH